MGPDGAAGPVREVAHRLLQSAAVEAISEGVEGVSTTAGHKGGRVATWAVLSPRGAVPVRPREVLVKVATLCGA